MGMLFLDTQTRYLINKIENIQSEAARIVTSGTKLTSIQKLYGETGWKNFWKEGKNINWFYFIT